MYELWTYAESILNERNGSTSEHEGEKTHDFDLHVEYMLENSSVEEKATPQWDMNTLQNMFFANKGMKEDNNKQNTFPTYADNNIMH